jgi:hypothetical protein
MSNLKLKADIPVDIRTGDLRLRTFAAYANFLGSFSIHFLFHVTRNVAFESLIGLQ